MLFKKTKVNAKTNSNKQANKNGSIKNSNVTTNVSMPDSSSERAVILQEVLSLGKSLNSLKTDVNKSISRLDRQMKKVDKDISAMKKQNKLHEKAFIHYVDNNGVKPKVKEECKAIVKGE